MVDNVFVVSGDMLDAGDLLVRMRTSESIDEMDNGASAADAAAATAAIAAEAKSK